MLLLLIICLALCGKLSCQKSPNAVLGRSAILHLFEWKFSDIGEECERFLAPKGFAGGQVGNGLD